MTDQRAAGSPGRPASDPGTPAVSAGQEWLRQLDWRQFEDLVGAAYRLQGYTVLPTSPGADGGIDLILTRGDERIFVQCKHWKAWQVGAPVIRELFGLVAANRATRGIVVTSGTFSREAIEFARQTGTELLDGPALLALVAIGNGSGAVSSGPSTQFSQPPGPLPAAGFVTYAPAAPTCPVCLAPMELHKVRRGPRAGSLFWGCTRYPGCRGTREAAPGTQLPPTAAQLARQRRDRRKLVLALLASLPALMLLVGAVVLSSLFRAVASAPTRSIPSAASAAPSAAAIAGMQGLGEQPMDIAVDSSGKRLYTANYVSGDVSVIDAASMKVVDTIDAPGKPVAVAVWRSTLYVADRAGKQVYAISLETNETTATFATDADPTDLAVDAGVKRLFIAHDDGTIRSYSLASGRRLPGLGAHSGSSIAVDVGEHELYANSADGVLNTYRVRTLEHSGISYVGGAGIGVDSKRQRLYVVQGSHLHEHNLLTGKSRTIEIGIDGQSVAVDPSTRTAFVADPDTNQVECVHLN